MSKQDQSNQSASIRQARPWFSGEPFERLIAIIFAVVSVLAAIIGFLEVDAGGRSDLFRYEQQQFAMQAVGGRMRGDVLVGHAWTDAYRTWLTLDTQAVLAENEGDSDAAARLLVARDRIATLTPLLQAPYFRPDMDRPNLRAYEADLYVNNVAVLTEQFLNADALANAWDDKAQSYVIQLTLITVALFFYGISLTVMGTRAWFFIALGTVMTLGTVTWTIFVVLAPVSGLPQPVIEAYANGVALAHQQRYQEAVQAFDLAIAQAPDYGTARYARANAHYALDQFAQADADYEAAMNAGTENVNVYWNAGWNAYRMGNYVDAIARTDQALSLAPDQLGLYFNRALAQLAGGSIDAAADTYAAAADWVTTGVQAVRAEGGEPPISTWWYLDDAVVDLHNLVTCIETGNETSENADAPCEGSPPRATIVDADEVAAHAKNWVQQLQTLSVSLEYNLSIVDGDSSQLTQIGPLSFVTGVYDEAGELVAQVPLDQSGVPLRFGMARDDQGQAIDTSLARADSAANRSIFLQFNYEQIDPGQLLVMKVYLDEREASGLRLAMPWTLTASGSASLPLTPGRTFTLAAGDYRVDLFVDGRFVQSGEFTIPASP